MPTISESKRHKIYELKNQGFNISQIAKKIHASRNTVKRYLRGKPYKNPNDAYPVQQQPQVAQIVETREVSGPTAVAVESYKPNPQPIQQRETPFRLTKELDEEDVHRSTREYTIGGRSVDEFLGREPSPARATYLGPPAPPDYPRFIPVPNQRIKPENDDRRDEDRRRRERDELVWLQQLLQKKKQEKKNAGVIRLLGKLDRMKRNDEHYAKGINEVMQLLLQQQNQPPVSTPPPVEPKPEQVPVAEAESQPETKSTFRELKNRLTGDIFEDSKYYNEGASHLSISDRNRLYSEHIRLLFGEEKDEEYDDEDEEEE
jgi:hypothetical protein